MRTWTLALLALSVAIPSVAQVRSARPDLNRFTGFNLPVEVLKTIKADKVEPGDAVEFRMLEPVLARDGIVIPEKAKLYGKVVLATGAYNGQYSYLALLVDRAEWDGRTLPLNAFVVGWEDRHAMPDAGANCAAAMEPQESARSYPTTAAQSQAAGFDHCERASTASERQDSQSWSQKMVSRDIEIDRDANSGSTILISRKNIRLPAGMYLVLQNVEQPSVAATAH